MPNLSEDANMRADRFVIFTSRYNESDVVYYTFGDQKRITFETYKRTTNYTPGPTDTYTVITAGQEYRPDMLSSQVYGVPDYWWKILEANNIKDIYEFKAGKNIRLPANVF